MSDDLRIELLLREEAERVLVPPQMPARVHRRILMRQVAALAFASLSIVTVALAIVVFPWGGQEVPPAGDGAPNDGGVRLLMSRADGVGWDMELRDVSDNRGGHHEVICVVVGTQDQCWDNERNRYGEANVVVGYVKALGRALIIVKTPADVLNVLMKEISGPLWGGMVASEGDVRSGRASYFYRLWDGQDVHGILTISGADVPMLEFSVEVHGGRVETRVNETVEEFPELKDFSGDKEVVASAPEAGGYSVYLRTTDSEVCLHIRAAYRCRDRNAGSEPIRLWVGESLRCSPDDHCGSDNHLTIIAGQVAADVAQIGIRDGEGTTFVQVGEPFGEGIFSTTIDGRLGDEADLVAFDSDGEELQSVPLKF